MHQVGWTTAGSSVTGYWCSLCMDVLETCMGPILITVLCFESTPQLHGSKVCRGENWMGHDGELGRVHAFYSGVLAALLLSKRIWSEQFKRPLQGFPDSSVGKESACNAGDPSSIPGSGRSAGEGNPPTPVFLLFPCGSAGKESTCNAGDLGLIPGLGRSPGEGKGYGLQYSGLENCMDYSPWTHKELNTTE